MMIGDVTGLTLMPVVDTRRSSSRWLITVFLNYVWPLLIVVCGGMVVSSEGRNSLVQVIQTVSSDTIMDVSSSPVCPLKTFVFLEARK